MTRPLDSIPDAARSLGSEPVPLIRDLPRAISAADQAAVLANMDGHVLTSHIRLRSSMQDIGWLETIVAGGLLDVGPDLAKQHTRASLSDIREDWASRVGALAGFMQGITLVLQAGPANTAEPEAHAVAVFGCTPEFREVLRSAVPAILRSAEQLLRHPAAGPGQRVVDEINHAVCRFLAAACVADLPDVVAEVASLWPEAAAVRMPLSDLGPHFAEFSRTVILSDEVTRSEAITVTPAYVALQLSRIACLDTLHAAAPQHLRLLGRTCDSGEPEDFDITGVQDATPLLCTFEAFEHELRREVRRMTQSQRPLAGSPLLAQAMRFWSADSVNRRPYRSAFSSAGVYDLDPSATFLQAIREGRAELVAEMGGRFGWDRVSEDVAGTVLAAALRSMDHLVDTRYQPAVLAALAVGESFVGADAYAVAATRVEMEGFAKPPLVFEPVATMIRAGFAEVVLEYLEHGVSPDAKPAPNGTSILEVAETIRPEVAALIRSWSARQLARKVAGTADLAPMARGTL